MKEFYKTIQDGITEYCRSISGGCVGSCFLNDEVDLYICSFGDGNYNVGVKPWTDWLEYIAISEDEFKSVYLDAMYCLGVLEIIKMAKIRKHEKDA